MKLLRCDAYLHIKLMDKVKILHGLKSILGTLQFCHRNQIIYMDLEPTEDAHQCQIKETWIAPKLQLQIKSFFSFMEQKNKVLYGVF